jgi:hypothetical protein
MSLPNFLVIGAQKSGTTSLYEYLRQHPQVFMGPVKEPDFFVSRGQPRADSPTMVLSMEDYVALFGEATDEVAIGEASHRYLPSEEAVGRIAASLPDVKLVAIVRNPVERAYSHWLHNVRNGRETLDFRHALDAETERLAADPLSRFGYVTTGRYYRQLSRYLQAFSRERLRVYLFDDLAADPAALVRDLFRFLEVDDAFQPKLERHMVSGLPRGRMGETYDRLRKSPQAVKLVKRVVPGSVRDRVRERFLKRPGLPWDVRQDLIASYREEIRQLEELLHRNLSSWLKA